MKETKPVWWFVFHKDQLLLEKKEKNCTIPFAKEAPVSINGANVHHFTDSDGTACKAVRIPELPENEAYTVTDLRSSYDYLPYDQFLLAGKAREILHWDKTSTYCPVCGTETEPFMPIAKKCPHCGFEMFPSISTAILALVRKEDSILLVHAHNFRGTFNSLVAGFLETGETLEECVAREVMEETGLAIQNISYFGSQPWPFPSGLMVGFIADYESGEIKLQEEELSSGAFYTKDNLPELPRKLSLARRMIDWWVEQE